MQRLLVELINNKDGFGCGLCVYGLTRLYVGCGWGKKLMLHWEGFLKELWVQFPHKLLVLQKNYVLAGQVCDWKI
jgi:hypothetical protein